MDVGDLAVVNRNSLVVVPRKDYLDWARGCPGGSPGMELDGLMEGGTVYLMPEVKASPEQWLRRNFAAIFEQELDAWYRDRDAWPQDRSLAAFRRFFDVRFCSMVFDLGEEPLEAE